VIAALAPAAGAEVLVVSNNEANAVPGTGTEGPAALYPDEIEVQGADGNITDLNVSVTLSHTFPDDLDIMLVSPEGKPEILMSDACGSGDLSGSKLTFDNQAGSTLSDGGPCSAGTFQPTNFGVGDVWPAPAPTAENTQLGDYNGKDPNGTWELFATDDLGGDSGSISSWSLTITTATAEVIIPGTGTKGIANPYPSTKTFNTPPGKVISDVNFRTPDISHTFADDIDMLLVGPQGQSTVLMSDACGGNEFQNFQWTFDDEATAPMTDETLTGCFPVFIKPSDFGTPETWPAPAPPQPYGKTLSVFDGLEGGAWKTFVNDDATSDTGFMTSWELLLTTRDAASTGFATTSAKASEGGKAILTVTRSGPGTLGPATLNVTTQGGSATPGADFAAPATLQFDRGQTSKNLEIPIAADKIGEAAESFSVVLSAPKNDAKLTGATAANVVIGPDNAFKFGKLKRNAKKGTAKLFVNTPGPGTLVMTGKQIKRVTKKVSKAGSVALPLQAKGNGLRKLAKEGDVKLTPKVTFTPTGGSALTLTKKAKLILND